MFGPGNEAIEALGERISALYKELSYPSAAKFKAALLKRGIDVPDSFVKQLTSEQEQGSSMRRHQSSPARSQRLIWTIAGPLI